MIIERIAQILDDIFDIPAARVEPTDHLRIDWGLDNNEMRAFNSEFCAEFDLPAVPSGLETVEDYARLVG